MGHLSSFICSYIMKWKLNAVTTCLRLHVSLYLLSPSEINTFKKEKKSQLLKKNKTEYFKVCFLQTDNSLEARWFREAFVLAKNAPLWKRSCSIMTSIGVDYLDLLLLWVLSIFKKKFIHMNQHISMNITGVTQLNFSKPLRTLSQRGKVKPGVFGLSLHRCFKLFSSFFFFFPICLLKTHFAFSNGPEGLYGLNHHDLAPCEQSKPLSVWPRSLVTSTLRLRLPDSNHHSPHSLRAAYHFCTLLCHFTIQHCAIQLPEEKSCFKYCPPSQPVFIPHKHVHPLRNEAGQQV